MVLYFVQDRLNILFDGQNFPRRIERRLRSVDIDADCAKLSEFELVCTGRANDHCQTGIHRLHACAYARTWVHRSRYKWHNRALCNSLDVPTTRVEFHSLPLTFFLFSVDVLRFICPSVLRTAQTFAQRYVLYDCVVPFPLAFAIRQWIIVRTIFIEAEG